MISAGGFGALRVAATLAHTIPSLRLRLREGEQVRACVARATDEAPDQVPAGAISLTPCGFRSAVIEAWAHHRCGRPIGLLDLEHDPAIDVGVPTSGRSWPGGIYRVPFEGRWLYATATTLEADIAHEVGRPVVAALGELEHLVSLGLRGDPATEVTILYAESLHLLTPIDELVVRDLFEALLAAFSTEELLRDVHAGAYS